MSFLGSATSRVTSRGNARCHHVPSEVPHPWALPGATMSLLQQCHIQGYVLGRCQVPPLSRSATSRGTTKCHHVPSPQVPHPGALPSATTLLKCHIQGHCQVPPHPAPTVPHPWSPPWALQVQPRLFSRSATLSAGPWDTARCHHVLPWQRCTQGHILGRCQVPPRPPLALSHPGSLPCTLPGATPSSPRDLGVSLVPRGLLTLPAGPAGIGSGTRSRAQVTPRWLLVTPRWLLVAPGLPHGRWGS